MLVTNNKQLNNYSTILLLSRRNTTLIPLSFFLPNSLDANTPIPCPLTNKPTNQPTHCSFPILWLLQTLKSILYLHTNIILFNSKLFIYPSTKLSTHTLTFLFQYNSISLPTNIYSLDTFPYLPILSFYTNKVLFKSKQ